MPKIPFRVLLADDLAAFVTEAVRDGVFESVDHLFAHAVAVVRTQTALGNTPDPTPPASLPPAVDLTRQGFDGPAFMANLVGKIEKKKADDKKPPK